MNKFKLSRPPLPPPPPQHVMKKSAGYVSMTSAVAFIFLYPLIRLKGKLCTYNHPSSQLQHPYLSKYHLMPWPTRDRA